MEGTVEEKLKYFNNNISNVRMALHTFRNLASLGEDEPVSGAGGPLKVTHRQVGEEVDHTGKSQGGDGQVFLKILLHEGREEVEW